MASKQEYLTKPTYEMIRGESSKSIIKFMITPDISQLNLEESSKLALYYPRDVDDFERNRALLIWYPEWRERLLEMSVICEEWKRLVENWKTIEELYEADWMVYGNKAYGVGRCCKYIRSLLSGTVENST